MTTALIFAGFGLVAAAYFVALLEIALDESRYYTGRHVRTEAYRPRHAAAPRYRLTWRAGQHAAVVTA